MVLKFFLRVFTVAFPVIFIMVSVNYLVDPALIFSNGEYEQQIANGLLNNKNIGITTNYDERKLQRLIIERMADTPDGIIVGSSRVMCIPLDTLNLENGFCNAVSGAVMEDIISIIGMYEDKDMLPDSIFIGIDPWLFNDNHADTRYRELITEYNIFSDKLNLEKIPSITLFYDWIKKMEQAVSPTYFKASVKNIRNIWKEKPSPLIISGLNSDYNNKLADGSVIYSKEYAERSADEVEQYVKATINEGNYYHSVNYNRISPVIINQLTNLVDFLQENDVDVVFILSPFHPQFYTHISESREYRMLIESEVFIRKFSEEKEIKIIGSFNPENLGAINYDFYDFMHPKKEFMAKLCSEEL